jgi:hypothetical protein
LRQINVNTEKLRRSHSELVELQLVLEAGLYKLNPVDDLELESAWFC